MACSGPLLCWLPDPRGKGRKRTPTTPRRSGPTPSRGEVHNDCHVVTRHCPRTQTGGNTLMTEHRIATQEQWQAERDERLAEEKDPPRSGDELAAKRRGLPWV